MVEKWKAGKDVMDQMRGLIAQYHPHLALIDKEIVVMFREKAVEKSGQVIPCTVSKISPDFEVMTDKKFPYHFKIEIGADVWNNEFDNAQREALLDHCLCAMRVEDDPEKGRKYSLRPPDFVGYKEEVERHGMWRPMDEDTLTIIEEMFGSKANG